MFRLTQLYMCCDSSTVVDECCVRSVKAAAAASVLKM